MIIDARQLPDGAVERARVCVIGTGPAGTTTARELAAAGIDVLVLEAGGRRAERKVQDTLAASSPLDPTHDPLDRARQKRLGGTSAQWGGRCVPFDTLDFEARPGLVDAGWPLSRSQMDPYYRRAADILQLGSWEWSIRDASTTTPDALTGEGSDVTDERIWRWSPPVRFADAYPELARSPRIRLLHHANVTRLVQEAPGGPVTAVEVSPRPGRRLTVHADVVVLAVGGLETARLLLASGGATGVGLGNSADLVGRHYMIHPLAEVGDLRLRNPFSAVDAATYIRARDGVWIRRLLQVDEDIRRRDGLLNMGFAVWYVDPRDPAHGDPLLSSFALARRALMRTGGFKSTGMHRRFAESGSSTDHLRNVAQGLPALAGFAGTWTRDRWLARRTLPGFARLARDGRYRLRFDAEQSPDPESRVVLGSDVDAFGVPRLEVRHRVGRADRSNYGRSLQIVATALEKAGTAAVELPSEEELFDLPFGDATHQMGLAKMGASPREGVVDADCRLWEAPNVHLAGSAVFPTSGMAGPTMTIVALAARLADRLAGRRPVEIRST